MYIYINHWNVYTLFYRLQVTSTEMQRFQYLIMYLRYIVYIYLSDKYDNFVANSD